MNTKTIARYTDLTVAQVNEAARDLNCSMHYRADLRAWIVTDRRQAVQLIEMLNER